MPSKQNIIHHLKNKTSMTNQQLIKHINALVDKRKKASPIVRHICLQHDHLTVTDLEYYLQLPFPSGVNTCIQAADFLSALKTMQQPSFHLEQENSLLIKDGEQELTTTTLPASEFPHSFLNRGLEFTQIGQWGAEEIAYAKQASIFVSNDKDDLRPTLSGVCAGDDIVGTDGHRLYRQEIKSLKEGIILPAKAVRILSDLSKGRQWKILKAVERVQQEVQPDKEKSKPTPNKGKKKYTTVERHYVAFISQDGISFSFQPIDGYFPNYKVILPKDDGMLQLRFEPEHLREALQHVLPSAHPVSQTVKLTINGSVKLYACNIEEGKEAEKTFKATYQFQEPNNDYFEISFNGSLLDSIIKQLEEPATFHLWNPKRLTRFNKQYYLLPAQS
jgi:DNA polymerase III sliding clamp (beta) subunit (PCNA family)